MEPQKQRFRGKASLLNDIPRHLLYSNKYSRIRATDNNVVAPPTGTATSTSTSKFHNDKREPVITKQVQNILNWPTDTISIDYLNEDTNNENKQCPPHTVIIFIPGNPGCVGWYVDMLYELLLRLGVGYAVRGVSYAGHGLSSDIVNVGPWKENINKNNNTNRDVHIPWTLNGQVYHKISWMYDIETEMNEIRRNNTPKTATTMTTTSSSSPAPKYVFISHSIGSYIVQKLLVLRRKDILPITSCIIHLMPFIRMDAPQPKQTILSTVASSKNIVIPISKMLCRLASFLPLSLIDSQFQDSIKDEEDRKVATGLVRQPSFAENFFQLGMDEVRNVPKRIDDLSLRIIGKQHQCRTFMLYCGGNDHWAPEFHMIDLIKLQQNGSIPNNIEWTYMPDLVHDFVVRGSNMVQPVINFCLHSITSSSSSSCCEDSDSDGKVAGQLKMEQTKKHKNIVVQSKL